MQIKTKYNIGDKVRDSFLGFEGVIVGISVQSTDEAFAKKQKWCDSFTNYYIEDENTEYGFRLIEEGRVELIEKAK